MMYPIEYLENRDIDWFFVCGGLFFHVASAGGSLPSEINDDEILRDVQHQIELLPDIYTNEEIEFNESALQNILKKEERINGLEFNQRECYVESFARMARKGFISIDKTDIETPTDLRYHIVCCPKELKRKPQMVGLISAACCLHIENVDNMAIVLLFRDMFVMSVDARVSIFRSEEYVFTY